MNTIIIISGVYVMCAILMMLFAAFIDEEMEMRTAGIISVFWPLFVPYLLIVIVLTCAFDVGRGLRQKLKELADDE